MRPSVNPCCAGLCMPCRAKMRLTSRAQLSFALLCGATKRPVSDLGVEARFCRWPLGLWPLGGARRSGLWTLVRDTARSTHGEW